MKFRTLVASTLFAATLGLASAPANATTYDFSSTYASDQVFNFYYAVNTADAVGPYTGYGKIWAQALAGPSGAITYNVDAIQGFANGLEIQGLSDYAFADNQISYDPTNPGLNNVDYSGLSFSTTANSYNLFYDGVGYSVIDQNSNPFGTPSGNYGSFVLALAAPEPATWALMLFGMVGLGFISSRRHKAITA